MENGKMAFEGINGKFNRKIAPNAFGVKPVEVKESKEVEEIAAPKTALKEETEASALKGLEIQGRTSVGQSVFAEDIAQCRELAKLLPENVNVDKYLTPLNIVSVGKVAAAAISALDETTAKTNAQALFETPEFKLFEQIFEK
jgi:hypothetical protein